MIITPELMQLADRLCGELKQNHSRIVFSESCTAGWVSALLSTIPGVSQFLCGSAVVYRELTKQSWLGVSADDLAAPEIGAVSGEVATQMALGVLERTPEADVAVSITGHLGPNAPAHLDGVVYIAVAQRDADDLQLMHVKKYQLATTCPEGTTLRWHRQQEAIALVFQQSLQAVQTRSSLL